MSEDPRKHNDGDRGAGGDGGGAGEDTFIDRHLGKIVAAALVIGLLGIAARALVA